MPFLLRNRYYLRVSSSSILPLYVYLDGQHVDWMSDRVLRQVVADLRPKIIPKLRAESDAHVGQGPAPANAKRGTVDVHRGDTYQFAYFLRETESHSVLIKTRNFVLDTDPPPPPEKREDTRKVNPPRKKRQKKTSLSRAKKRKARRGRAGGEDSEDEEDLDSNGSDPFVSDDLPADEDEDGDIEMTEDLDTNTRKGTRRVVEVTASVDVKMEEDEQGLPQTEPSATTTGPSHVGEATTTSVELDEDDETKPKLALELKYRAFSNFSRCLCVVVEPWPPQRSGTRAPSLAPSATTRASSVAPTTASEFGTNSGQRAKTPLFFPDADDEPTTPSHTRFRTLPPVPLFNDPPISHDADNMEEWDDNAGLMQFSQLLNATGRVGGADAEEEDEFDGMALFADADEAKEL
ncbi:hypothetical protein BC826DRAFT_1101093 [Russula brevipes]|nr:hypothetical protein BC826DRAFT_1101093 [Russula brevipes]